jgi:hypothetical protein
MDYKETIKERLNILSPKLRTFILDEKWRSEAEKIGKQFNFDEEKYAAFENEIFFVLLGFEPKSNFAENIKNELQIDSNMAGWVTEDVEKNIFSKVANEIEITWQNTNLETDENLEPSAKTGETENKGGKSEESQMENNIGQSFEQIILNQAKAMQPARTPGDEPARPPQNLPTNKPRPEIVHDYTTGSDPYREPLE